MEIQRFIISCVTTSRWMTNRSTGRMLSKNIQPSMEQLYDIAHHLDVNVKELFVSSK